VRHTFPCQELQTSFDLPTTELLARWGQEVANGESQNSQQETSWVEGWMTGVPMAPALLTELSCKLNLRPVTILDDRESSSLCIRFLQLRGQRPSDQREITTWSLQERCLQLVLEIQRICCPDERPFEVSDLEATVFTNKEARTERTHDERDGGGYSGGHSVSFFDR
jgi:hypothetical protein